MSGFGQTLADEIRQLQGVKGDLDNVLSAVLQNLAERFVEILENPKVWPKYATDGPQDPASLRKNKIVPYSRTTPARRGVPHSINRWRIVRMPNGWSVINPAEYASYIHDNKPAGNLIRREVLPALQRLEDMGLSAVRGPILRLFEDAY